MPAGEFKIWALDHHRLCVEFSVAAEHKGEAGRTANAGDGHGMATIATGFIGDLARLSGWNESKTTGSRHNPDQIK